MIQTARKFAAAFSVALTLTCALSVFFHWTAPQTVAQTSDQAQHQSGEVDVEPAVKPQWRYTRFGWQDANEWAMMGQIEGVPDRRFDNLHPVVLAMLILFSVLLTIFWASNEWELAQVVGEHNRSQPSATD